MIETLASLIVIAVILYGLRTLLYIKSGDWETDERLDKVAK